MIVKLGLVSALFLIATTGAAYAYIDPNTGGLIFQMLAPILAIVAGLWIAAKEKIAKFSRQVFHHFTSAREKRND